MLSAIIEALDAQKSMNIKLREEVTYVKIDELFDGEVNERTVKSQ